MSQVDTQFLQTLVGYNARRVSLTIISQFIEDMAPLGLRPVDFSVLSVIRHNPGVMSKHICTALSILPPNCVGMIRSLEGRGLIERTRQAKDKRAVGLHLTEAGEALMATAEKTADALEIKATSKLTTPERATLNRLLQKVYLPTA